MKSSKHRRRAWWLVVVVALISTAALCAFVFRPDRALRVGTSVVSEALCGGVFVSKLDPQRVFAEDIAPNRGLQLLRRHLHYTIDHDAQTVSTTWLGHFRSVAHFQAGYGCTLGDGVSPPRTVIAPLDSPSEPPLEAGSSALQAALAHAFEEPRRRSGWIRFLSHKCHNDGCEAKERPSILGRSPYSLHH
jgi:hypothetical protein